MSAAAADARPLPHARLSRRHPCLDVIKVPAIALLVLIPLAFFMKRPPKGKRGPVGH